MPMSHSALGLWLTLAIAGTAANDIWRMTGVLLSRGIDPQSSLMLWVKDVSTALVAALIARLLLEPTGALATIDSTVRFMAFGAGVAVYFLSRRHLAVALACAELMFFAMHWVLQPGL
jgi:Branched-chain amino acid transport protein (AzlD)